MHIQVSKLTHQTVVEKVKVDRYVTVPGWVGRDNCDHCRFPLEHNEVIMAADVGGATRFYHLNCWNNATSS